MPTASLQRGKALAGECPVMTRFGSSSGALWYVEYTFMAIIVRSTLTEKGST